MPSATHVIYNMRQRHYELHLSARECGAIIFSQSSTIHWVCIRKTFTFPLMRHFSCLLVATFACFAHVCCNCDLKLLVRNHRSNLILLGRDSQAEVHSAYHGSKTVLHLNRRSGELRLQVGPSTLVRIEKRNARILHKNYGLGEVKDNLKVFKGDRIYLIDGLDETSRIQLSKAISADMVDLDADLSIFEVVPSRSDYYRVYGDKSSFGIAGRDLPSLTPITDVVESLQHESESELDSKSEDVVEMQSIAQGEVPFKSQNVSHLLPVFRRQPDKALDYTIELREGDEEGKTHYCIKTGRSTVALVDGPELATMILSPPLHQTKISQDQSFLVVLTKAPLRTSGKKASDCVIALFCLLKARSSYAFSMSQEYFIAIYDMYCQDQDVLVLEHLVQVKTKSKLENSPLVKRQGFLEIVSLDMLTNELEIKDALGLDLTTNDPELLKVIKSVPLKARTNKSNYVLVLKTFMGMIFKSQMDLFSFVLKHQPFLITTFDSEKYFPILSSGAFNYAKIRPVTTLRKIINRLDPEIDLPKLIYHAVEYYAWIQKELERFETNILVKSQGDIQAADDAPSP